MAEGLAFQPWDPTAARALVDGLKQLPGATLPILHALQETFGYVHDDAISLIAEALNLSRAEVVGVVHFYHDFRHEPPARHVLKVCRAEACQAMGCEALTRHLEAALETAIGGTSPDGAVTLEAVYCLGNCALSPAVMLDGRLIGRVTPERAKPIVATVRQ
ncbi:MAG: formate dehydrogenase subunit gamma [Dehalococcoidia bacterium]